MAATGEDPAAVSGPPTDEDGAAEEGTVLNHLYGLGSWLLLAAIFAFPFVALFLLLRDGQ